MANMSFIKANKTVFNLLLDLPVSIVSNSWAYLYQFSYIINFASDSKTIAIVCGIVFVFESK